jgi:hypothetical protein
VVLNLFLNSGILNLKKSFEAHQRVKKGKNKENFVVLHTFLDILRFCGTPRNVRRHTFDAIYRMKKNLD